MPIEALEGVTDQDLFDQANADEAPAEEAVVEVPEAQAEQPEPQEQPRDEAGRFAAQAVDAQADQAANPLPVPAAGDDNPNRVPSFRLKEEAEARRQLENDLAQERADKAALRLRLEALERPAAAPRTEPQVEEPDPLLDPKAYREFIREETRKEILSDRREASLAQAHRTYKTEFEEAYAAAQQRVDPVLKIKMQNSRDPGETLIEWHRAEKTRAEVGTDPNAYFDKRLEAYLADPANQGKVMERIRGGVQQPQPGLPRQAAPVNLPPSLTRVANAAATQTAEDDDVSDDGLWRHANA